MTKRYIDSDDYTNKVCDAFGCVAAATTSIELEIGNESITLNVCGTCVDYFKENEGNGISNSSGDNFQ